MRKVGIESCKSYQQKLDSGFWDRYITGPAILDIGFKGHVEGHLPIMPTAIGVDLDYPGYDGFHLPFPDESQDVVYSSHMLEHTPDPIMILRDWWRVLKFGGHMIIAVPHAFIYERKLDIPHSKWNGDHRRPYTPARLMKEVEAALKPNSYRLRHLIDNDLNYNYSIVWDQHPEGCYEIEAVIQKIRGPTWEVTSG